MVNLELTAGGILLPVRAQAGARRNGIVGMHDGALKVAVTQAAEKGKANKAIIDVLCEDLGLRRSQLELISGATSPQKRFVVRDVTLKNLSEKIVTALQSP
jgi:uncharacterized protein (TIGR00251 family)